MTIIDTTAGAVFVALLLSSILFGVTCTQAIHFFQRCRSDNWSIVFVVVSLLLLDVAFMILAAYGAYEFVIRAIGDVNSLLRVPWALTAIILISLTTVFFVRGFFIYRIWLLSSRNRVILSFNCTVLIGAFGLGIYSAARIIPVRFTPDLANVSWEIYSLLCPGMVADFFIASMLCFFLFRSRNEFAKTKSLVNTLAAYAINTGLLTVFWDICMIISYARASHTLLFVIFYLSISKLYINALLASLNSRPALRARHTGFSSYRLSERRRLDAANERSSDRQGSELEAAMNIIDVRLSVPISSDRADDSKSSDISLQEERKQHDLRIDNGQ